MIREYEVVLSTTTIQYLSANIEDLNVKPIMLFFHGFPECSWAWETYLLEMSAEYCVIAPDLPGYRLSSGFKSSDEYNIENLIGVMAEFVERILNESSQRKLHLIAHDWGGAIAWPLAAFYEPLFHSLTIINAAHPSAFTREMRDNLVQQEKSEYIADFMQDDAVTQMQSNDYVLFRKLLGHQFFHSESNIEATDSVTASGDSIALQAQIRDHKKSLFTLQQLSEYKRQWDDSKTLTNMLNYYRKMPQIKTKAYVSQQAPLKIPNIRINMPTLVIWGENDSAFVIDNLNGLDEWVPNLRICKVRGASHWVHHEQPEYIMSILNEFLINLLLNNDEKD
jgi:pimeloyl-ACP methyl ester carboxylesterase